MTRANEAIVERIDESSIEWIEGIKSNRTKYFKTSKVKPKWTSKRNDYPFQEIHFEDRKMVKKAGNNRDEGPRRSKEVEWALSKATLKFLVPKANETQIMAKFTDALGNEVKEYISVYDESDSNALLVTLCKQVFKIGQTYGLFAKKSKGLAQVH